MLCDQFWHLFHVISKPNHTVWSSFGERIRSDILFLLFKRNKVQSCCAERKERDLVSLRMTLLSLR